MAQLLDNILAYKRKEVDAAKAARRCADLRARAEASRAGAPLRRRRAVAHRATANSR